MNDTVDLSTRFDAGDWVRALSDKPANVAQQVELLLCVGDEAVEAVLAGLDCGSRYPVAPKDSRVNWALPRSLLQGQCAMKFHERFSAHLAASLGLAAMSDSPSARCIRARLRELHFPQRAPWWLTSSLEGFTGLTHFYATMSPWHAQANLPARFLCMPSLCELSLSGAAIGEQRLHRCTWNLPAIQRLSLSGNHLTRVPDAVLELSTLEHLYLMGNPLRELPVALAELPRLRYIDLRYTGLTVVPKRFKERPDIHVHFDR